MKLYYAPGACSLSPHIALREAGLKFDLEKVDLQQKKLGDGRDYGSVVVQSYVPALELSDGKMLTEGPAIVQYIADQAPNSGLAPANGTWERYRLQEALNFVSTELHKKIGGLFAPGLAEDVKDQMRGMASKRIELAQSLLGQKSYLMGETFTVADGYLFTVLRWTKPLQIDITKWPQLVAFMGRVQARPKVQEAMKAEGI